MFSIGHVLLVLHNDDATRFRMVRWACFAIHRVKQRTVPVVFRAEGSFDELCNPGYPRVILLGINLLILLTIENLGRLV